MPEPDTAADSAPAGAPSAERDSENRAESAAEQGSAMPPGAPAPATLVGRPYREAVSALWGELGVWDTLRYDEDGFLWFGDLRLVDAVRAYGTPLEVVDAGVVERRARAFRELAEGVAARLGYPARLDFLYAAKANMASEVTHAAYRAGWHAETSGPQDLAHLRWMRERGLIPTGLRVVCNGFKLPDAAMGRRPDGLHDAAGLPPPDPRSVPLPPAEGTERSVREPGYAGTIRAMAREGWPITPILDAGEIEAFAGGDPDMDAGLRLKFGPVGTEAALARRVSRFGLDLAGLRSAAARIEAAPGLRLRTLHAMVGAAHTIPVPTMVESYALACRIWADLRRDHTDLRELNLGGGVPPLGEAYAHEALVEGILRGAAKAAAEAGVPAPELTFELGSLVAAECGVHVFRGVQLKRNHQAPPGREALPWLLLDGGLMAAIPDMLLIDKPFRFLALAGADRPARALRLGDLTCDTDGRYPPEAFGPEACVLAPEGELLHLAVLGVGAYQEILSGVRGAHHCGLLEAMELILEPDGAGGSRARVMPRQTAAEAAALLGYTEDGAAALRRAMGDAPAMPPAGEGVY